MKMGIVMGKMKIIMIGNGCNNGRLMQRLKLIKIMMMVSLSAGDAFYCLCKHHHFGPLSRGFHAVAHSEGEHMAALSNQPLLRDSLRQH